MAWTTETTIDFTKESPVVGYVTKVNGDGSVWIEGGWWGTEKHMMSTTTTVTKTSWEGEQWCVELSNGNKLHGSHPDSLRSVLTNRMGDNKLITTMVNKFKKHINQNFTPWIKPNEGDVWALKHNNRLNWTTKDKWLYKNKTGYKLWDDRVLLKLDEQGSGAYLTAVTKIMDLLWANEVEGEWKVEEKNGRFRGVKV